VELDGLYTRSLLRLAAALPPAPRLAAPHVTGVATSRPCGSRIVVDLRFDGETVSAFGQDVKACVIGQAVASVIGRAIVGLSISEIAEGERALQGLLVQRELPLNGPWQPLAALLPVGDRPDRHYAALLPFEAVRNACDIWCAREQSS